jgi:hypothetical protein
MKVKAILIDAEKQEVRDIELDAADGSAYQGIKKNVDCDCICSGWTWYDQRSIPKAVLYVDDEGMINGTSTSFLLQTPDGVGGLRCNPAGPDPLFGNGVICGCNAQGETVDVPFKAEELAVAWPILF